MDVAGGDEVGGRRDRERRQLELMLDRIARFRSGRLSIGPTTNDLEALLNELELADDRWIDEFTEAWSDLEIPYAVALDRMSPLPTIEDVTVRAGVDRLEVLVRSHLGFVDGPFDGASDG